MPFHDPQPVSRGGSAGVVTGAAPAPGALARASLSRRPSAIGLARLSHRRVFPPGGVELYRNIARLTELGPEHDFLVVPVGTGVTAEFLARSTGASGAGVELDGELAEMAAAHVRSAGLSDRLQIEHAPLEDLPYQDAVFDVVIGEIALGALPDPAAAVRELVRVTRPMGTVILVQLIWTGNIEDATREALGESLGIRPLLLVEWKRLLREAGAVDLYTEDWSDCAVSPRTPLGEAALGGLGPIRDRLGVLYRAWRRWGWRGMQQAMASRSQAHALIARERVLGLSLIRGTRWEHADDPES